jgi:hypothetical protein
VGFVSRKSDYQDQIDEIEDIVGDIEDFLDEHALDVFPRDGQCWVVVTDDPSDMDGLPGARVFKTERLALMYAKACSRGNIDRVVLKVAEALFIKSSWERKPKAEVPKAKAKAKTKPRRKKAA